METGHYAPPRAPVADAPAPGTSSRWLAFAAVALVGFVALLQFLSMIQAFMRMSGTDAPLWIYLPATLEFVLPASVAVLLFRKKGWARWLLIPLTLWRSWFRRTT